VAFSNEWEQIYSNNAHMSVWPWSDLVSYVMRYSKPDRAGYRVLELGCGAGANIPFFVNLGVDYYAIEGSQTIVNMLREQYPQLRERIIVGDFSHEMPFEGEFDLIVDRASVTTDTTDTISKILDQVYQLLKPGGKFIGIDWYSTEHSQYGKGTADADPYTYKDFSEGQFSGLGRIHFSDKKHLAELFARFELEILEHKSYRREIPADRNIMASWNLVARRI